MLDGDEPDRVRSRYAVVVAGWGHGTVVDLVSVRILEPIRVRIVVVGVDGIHLIFFEQVNASDACASHHVELLARRNLKVPVIAVYDTEVSVGKRRVPP